MGICQFIWLSPLFSCVTIPFIFIFDLVVFPVFHFFLFFFVHCPFFHSYLTPRMQRCFFFYLCNLSYRLGTFSHLPVSFLFSIFIFLSLFSFHLFVTVTFFGLKLSIYGKLVYAILTYYPRFLLFLFFYL